MKASASFRERALHESLRYGDDPYVFLRELVQNARDACARRVDVAVSVADGKSRIVFEDDGCGMSFAHAQAFLFRLYASSKEGNHDNAGHFGVGFWSVLRWQPTALRIESRTQSRRGDESWGVALDGDLRRVTDIPCTLEAPGTRIVLERASAENDLMELARAARDRLAHYCRYVRVRGGKERLELVCNGERVDCDMTVESITDGASEMPPAMTFASHGASGIVALGTTPKVQLYARGLLVTEATVLDELDGSTGTRLEPHAHGLAPVIVLNSDRLDVVLSRRKPRDGRELRRLMRLARSRLERLVEHTVDGVVVRSPLERAADLMRDAVRALGGGLAVAVLAVWLLVIGIGALTALVLWRVPGERPVITIAPGGRAPLATVVSAPSSSATVVAPVAVGTSVSVERTTARPIGNIVGYGGAIVDVPDTVGPSWSFDYKGGAANELFKALTLDSYEPLHGFVRRELPVVGAYRSVKCFGRCAEVSTQVIANDAPFVLPTPTGQGVVDGSVTLDGEPQTLVTNAVGEALVILEAGRRGTLRYRVARDRASEEIASPIARHDAALIFPPDIMKLLRDVRTRPMAERVKRISDFVRERLRYDVTPMTAATFAQSIGDWHERVLAVRAGDCDVKNGLTALLLRQVGIEARLAIGIAGEDGHARPSLHAWTEYFVDRRWQSVDATGQPVDAMAQQMVAIAAMADTKRREQQLAVSAAPPSPVPVAPSSKREAEPRPESKRPVKAVLPARPVDPGQSTRLIVEVVPVDTTAPALPSVASTPGAAPATRAGLTALLDEAAAVLFTGLARAAIVPRTIWLGTAGIASAMAVSFWLLRRRVREHIVTTGPLDTRRATLAKMVRDMLTQPHAWRGVGRAWHQRILPVLSGRPMSLEEALRRARDNVLFVSRSHSKLASLAASCGTPVLDAADPFFGKVVVPLLRTVDLDTIEPLLGAARHASDERESLARANAVLKRADADVRFVMTEALQDAPLRDVDLTRVSLPKRLAGPRRFIAVSPTHRDVRIRLDAMERDPDRGVFMWLDWSVERSELLSDRAARVREQAAVDALDKLGA